MMENGGGWIKLYRDIRRSPVWLDSTPEQKVVLITLLTMAAHKKNSWLYKGEMYTVNAGQILTSVQSIVSECGKGLSTRKVRTALKRLKKYGFLTIESTKKNSLVTIINWGLYQDTTSTGDKPCDEQATNRRQSGDNQATSIKNVKNDKNVKKLLLDEPTPKQTNKIFITPNIEDVRSYCYERHNGIDPQKFFDYYEANGWKVGKNPMKDWRAAVRTWERRDGGKKEDEYGSVTKGIAENRGAGDERPKFKYGTTL